MKSDFEERGRVYFPGVNFEDFSKTDKQKIEEDIRANFDKGYEGILLLPKGVKLGVYLAYIYYTHLFEKIKNASVEVIKERRVRINDRKKAYLLFSSVARSTLNLL